MQLSSELIIACFVGLVGAIAFLFKQSNKSNESFKKATLKKMEDMSSKIEDLNKEILNLTKERADLMYKVGRLEEENKSLRREINRDSHEEEEEETKTQFMS